MRFNTYGHSLGLSQELTRFKTFPLCRQLYRKTRLKENAHNARFPQSRFSIQLCTRGKGLRGRQFLTQTQAY